MKNLGCKMQKRMMKFRPMERIIIQEFRKMMTINIVDASRWV